MTAPIIVLGIDPGPIPGICELILIGDQVADVWVFQCSAIAAPWLVGQLLASMPDCGADGRQKVLAIERFVVGHRAAGSAHATAGRITRDLIAPLREIGMRKGARVVLRSASEVMPWATNKRLDAAGLLTGPKGMPHALAATRHALYAAVRECGLPDPLSTKAMTR